MIQSDTLISGLQCPAAATPPTPASTPSCPSVPTYQPLVPTSYQSYNNRAVVWSSSPTHVTGVTVNISHMRKMKLPKVTGGKAGIWTMETQVLVKPKGALPWHWAQVPGDKAPGLRVKPGLKDPSQEVTTTSSLAPGGNRPGQGLWAAWMAICLGCGHRKAGTDARPQGFEDRGSWGGWTQHSGAGERVLSGRYALFSPVGYPHPGAAWEPKSEGLDSRANIPSRECVQPRGRRRGLVSPTAQPRGHTRLQGYF